MSRAVAYGSAFATVLGMLAACFKDPGFAEEEEWRLVIRQWATDSSATQPDFPPGLRNVVPFLRFSWDSDEGAALRAIKVGPNHTSLRLSRPLNGSWRRRGWTA